MALARWRDGSRYTARPAVNAASMMHCLARTERFLRRTVLSLLAVLALGGVLAYALHLSQHERRWLDLVLPPLLTLVMLGLFVHLLRKPHALLPVIRAGALCGVAGLAIPAWYYTIHAWFDPRGTLVDTLPPMLCARRLPPRPSRRWARSPRHSAWRGFTRRTRLRRGCSARTWRSTKPSARGVIAWWVVSG
jgi:hypothetical protein